MELKPYLGLTANVAGTPHLITGFEENNYILEDENGNKKRLANGQFEIDVNFDDHNMKIATFREWSLNTDEVSHLHFSNLIYDNDMNQWDFFYKKASGEAEHILKLGYGDMIAPGDTDPQSEEYPDPLSEPEAFVQKALQEINSAKRSREEGTLDEDRCEMLDLLPDFFKAVGDPEIDGNELPGVKRLMLLVNSSPNKNGISTVASFTKEAFAFLAPLLGFLGKSAATAVGGKLLSNFLGGGGQGGGQGPIGPAGSQIYTSSVRFRLPESSYLDNFEYDITKTSASPGPKGKDNDTETMRQQVISALKSWADSGTVDDHATWWVRFNYSHEAETIAGLMSILQSVPADFHNAVLTNPLSPSAPNNTGLPPSPAPIGQNMKPQSPVQPLIPGAITSSILKDSAKWGGIEHENEENVGGESVEVDEDDVDKIEHQTKLPGHKIEEQNHPSFRRADINSLTNPNPSLLGQPAPQTFDLSGQLEQNQIGAQMGLSPSQTGQVPPPPPWSQIDQQQTYQDMIENNPALKDNPMAGAILNNAVGTGQAPVPIQVPHPSQQLLNPNAGDQGQVGNLPRATTSSYTDSSGNLLQTGSLYKMTSPESPVPDYVRIVDNGSNLALKIVNGDPNGLDLTLDENQLRQSKFNFEPVSQKEAGGHFPFERIPPQAFQDARDWAKDNVWKEYELLHPLDQSRAIDALSDEEIYTGVHNNYEGGWPGFLETGQYNLNAPEQWGEDSEEYGSAPRYASLTLSQQQELINESGVARNLDRLNLDNTHYEPLTESDFHAMMNSEIGTLGGSFSESIDIEGADLFF